MRHADFNNANEIESRPGPDDVALITGCRTSRMFDAAQTVDGRRKN